MAEELVDIIDHNDCVIKTVTRKEMRKNMLPHRATYVLIVNSEGKILVELRTLCKDYAPGLYDACVGGVVQSGEDIDESALREVAEEVGITGQDIKEFISLGKILIPHQISGGFTMAYMYLMRSDGIAVRQKDEVSAMLYLSFADICRLKESFTRDSFIACSEAVKTAAAKNIKLKQEPA